jgi:hypothetical protein
MPEPPGTWSFFTKGPFVWHCLSEVKKQYGRRIRAFAAEADRDQKKQNEPEKRGTLE